MCSIVAPTNLDLHALHPNLHNIPMQRVRRGSLPDIHALHTVRPVALNACQCEPFGSRQLHGMIQPPHIKPNVTTQMDMAVRVNSTQPSSVSYSQRRRDSAPQIYNSAYLREAPMLPQPKHESRPSCHICKKSLYDIVTCSNPDWPNYDICETCFDSLPRCVSCERRNTIGRNVCASSNVCIDCVRLAPVFTISDAEACLQEALEFYENQLNLVFTEEQLKHQFMSDDRYVQILEDEKKKQRRRRASMTAETQMTVITHSNPYVQRESTNILPQQLHYKQVANIPMMEKRQPPKSGSCAELLETQYTGRMGLTNSHTPASTVARILGKNFIKPVPLSLMNCDPSKPRNSPAMHTAKYGKCESCKLKMGGSEKRFVNKIEVVKGLPKALFTSHLCHELMHAYIHLNNFTKPTMKTEEGFCNAISYLYLQNELMSYSFNPEYIRASPMPHYSRELIEFNLRKIEKNTNEVYGDGFREAKKAVNKHGLPQTLATLKMTSAFPTV